MEWTPKSSDIEWMTSLLHDLKDGGVWIVPGEGSSFTFYHRRKEYLLAGPCDDTVRKVLTILKRLGWRKQ
jgi:hypothetical protein